jgi:hypothetical protein
MAAKVNPSIIQTSEFPEQSPVFPDSLDTVAKEQ